MKKVLLMAVLAFLSVSVYAQEGAAGFYVGARGGANFMSYDDEVINLNKTFKDTVGTFSLAAGYKADRLRAELEFFHNGKFEESYNHLGSEINGSLKSYGGLFSASVYIINEKSVGVFVGAGIGGAAVKGEMSSPGLNLSDGFNNKVFLVLALQTGFELALTDNLALEAMLRYYYMDYTESNEKVRKINALSPTLGLKFYF